MSALLKHKKKRVQPGQHAGMTFIILAQHMRAHEWKGLKQALWALDPRIVLRAPAPTLGHPLHKGGVRLVYCPAALHVRGVLDLLQARAFLVGGHDGVRTLSVADLTYATALTQAAHVALTAQLGLAPSLCAVMTAPQAALAALSPKK